MKRHFILSSICTALLSIGILVIPAIAAPNLGSDIAGRAADQAGYAAATETSLAETIGTVVKVLMSFMGIIFTVLIFYAGFLWMTAQGESEKVNKAMDIIRTSIIGLIIAISSYSLSAFVVDKILEKTAQ